MFGARIAMLRRSANLSQQELARLLGVSASTIGMYEQSRREPACETVVALAKIFHVSTDFLLTGETSGKRERAQLRARCQTLLQEMGGKLILRDASGKERTFGEQDLALFLAAILD